MTTTYILHPGYLGLQLCSSEKQNNINDDFIINSSWAEAERYRDIRQVGLDGTSLLKIVCRRLLGGTPRQGKIRLTGVVVHEQTLLRRLVSSITEDLRLHSLQECRIRSTPYIRAPVLFRLGNLGILNESSARSCQKKLPYGL
jgi:hypothetical protein